MCAFASVLCGSNASAEVVEYSCGATESDNVIVSIDTQTGVMTVSGTGKMIGYTYNTVPWSSYKSSVTTGAIEEGVENIGAYAFYQFSAMTSVALPSTVTSIDKYAFSGCSSLTEVGLSTGISTIGEYAFYSCKKIANLTLPESITSIGRGCFNYCEGLKTLVIEGTIAEIPEMAFANCSALEKVSLPEGLKMIGKQAFDRNTKLTSITLPSTLTTISASAFEETGLNSIVIPKSVTSIAGSTGAGSWTAFNLCNSLTSIVVEEENPKYDSRDNCNTIIETATNKLIIGCNSSVIPNTVEVIGSHSFYNLPSLKEITIPTSVTTVEYQAFAYCQKFQGTIDIPKSVTSVEKNAFEYIGGYQNNSKYKFDLRRPIYLKDIPNYCFSNSKITGTLVLGAQVETIGNFAFSNADMTTLVSLAETAPTIGSMTFNGASYNCTLYYPKGSDYSSWSNNFKSMIEVDLNGTCGTGLTWEFDTETYTLKISGNGTMTNYSSAKAVPWNVYAKAIESVILPNEQTTIGAFAFYGCKNLTSVIYEGENKLTAGSYAFYNIDENAVLYVKEGKKADYSDVTGVDVKEITLALDITEATIGYAEPITLTQVYSLADFIGDVNYTWTSSDLTVATVMDGVVSPVNTGETDVKVSVITPGGNTLEAVCRVTVVDATSGIENVEEGTKGNGVMHDLMGRKVVNPAQGIYIKNGKKFIVR